MMITTLVATALALSTPTSSPSAVPQSESGVAAYMLTIAHERREQSGTCVLVAVERDAIGATLYFVTAAHLFRDAFGSVLVSPSIAIATGSGQALTVRPTDVAMPLGAVIDVAVLKVRTLGDPPLAARLSTLVPATGAPFTIAAVQVGKPAARIDLRVATVSTLAIAGDRALGRGPCEGAPAVVGDAVFGVVSRCADGQRPVIVPFAAVAGWLGRRLPPGTLGPPPLHTLTDSERVIPGPLLAVSCAESRSGEVDVPFTVSPGEVAFDASATLTTPSTMRLAELTVVRLAERTLRLRFSLEGHPPPAFAPPKPCPQTTALVSVTLGVVTVRRP